MAPLLLGQLETCLPISKTFSTERICAFTDGVYAIVITLLILELKALEVPGRTGEKLLLDYEQDQLAVLMFFGNIAFSGMTITLLREYVLPKKEWQKQEQ